uniref:Tetratricopeptide repeat protein n=1 Tax=candidate division WOR-3 bacterium TaxID=2052148 RepID=A0A7V0Z5P5_UNCW3
MRRLFFIILVISKILLSQKNDAIDTARDCYQKENYTGTIMTLENALPEFNETEKIEALKYLGCSYAKINDKISAKEHFKSLLKLNPKFKLNKEDADSSVIKILNDAKKEIAQESAMCSCFIPGAGQLLKGDEKKSKLIMLGASLSLVSSIYFWIETENKKNDYLKLGPDSIKYIDDYYNIYNRWFHISLLSSSVFAGFYFYSILDALHINKEVDIANEGGGSLNFIPEMHSVKIEYKIKF